MTAGYVETAPRRRADAGLWVSLSNGGEELKTRNAGTKEVAGKQLLREAEEFGRAETSPQARAAGRSQGSIRGLPTFRGPSVGWRRRPTGTS